MDSSLGARIAQCYRDAADDGALVEELQRCAGEFGDRVFQRLLEMLVGMHFEAEVARRHFEAILVHHADMAARLGRPVRLLPAVVDYFSQQGILIERLRLIEVAEFERVLEQATHDTLTGLSNRQYFDDVLAQQIALAERMQSSIALLFIDVDDFKSINDTHGHQVGDQVLQDLASIIREQVRHSDIAARYGGEEFIVLMPNTGALSAAILAERIRAAVAAHDVNTDGGQLRATISAGIAAYPDHAARADELVYFADSALYRAKGAGKNTVCLFKDESRRYLRVPFRQAVRVKRLDFSDDVARSAESRNIGVGGVLIRYASRLDIGDPVQIGIPLDDDEPLLLIGHVVRVEDVGEGNYDLGVALAFRELEKLARSEIAELLSTHRDGALG